MISDIELAIAVERILGFNPVDMFGEDWDVDPRVAMALAEKCDEVTLTRLDNGEWEASIYAEDRGLAFNECLSAAIVEAAVLALS